jgi:hypothetical protein
MIIRSLLEIPESIQLSILNGTMCRTGGVIQWASGSPRAGEVVMWLRECGLDPIPSNQIASAIGPVGRLLQLGGGLPSLLNLGATTVFAVATMHKLGNISSQLKEVHNRLDRLEWAVECGFAAILGKIDWISHELKDIALNQEVETWADARTAAKLAWEAQELEPCSSQRIQRLENALMLATKASERINLLASHDVDAAINLLESSHGSSTDRLAALKERVIFRSPLRIRQAVVLTSLRAGIQAETGSPSNSAAQLTREYGNLKARTASLGFAVLRGGSSGVFAYDDLLAAEYKDILPVSRIARLAELFDPEVGGLPGIIEMIREHENAYPIHDDHRYTDWGRKQLLKFLDQLEGSWEDLDRMNGYAAEYNTAASAKMNIYEYRKALQVEELPADRKAIMLGRDAQATD